MEGISGKKKGPFYLSGLVSCQSQDRSNWLNPRDQMFKENRKA